MITSGHLLTNNPLIIKDQDGKSKPVNYQLPPQNFTYGKPTQQNHIPINKITNQWYLSNQNSLPATTGQKDFIKSNKLTLKCGIHTSKDQRSFRNNNHMQVKRKYGSKNICLLVPIDTHVYGQPNRPSTPVKLVLGNCYSLIEQEKKQKLKQSRFSSSFNNKNNEPYNTKGFSLRKSTSNKLLQFYNKSNKDSTFKMSKFISTSTPKINSNLKAFGLNSLRQL